MKFLHFILVFLFIVVGVNFVGAQQIQEIPPDPEVRIGKLDNGLTYYIRHNERPAGMAEFYIFHHVGAIQEEDTQTGLAHFLEHMAFNGTINLPNKQLINWLESVGVKFGENLNAGTAVEMTYYTMSQVPVPRESIIDSALLILHDWSHFIALDSIEIDNERGVIIEELRQMNNASFRIRQKSVPTLYNGNKYAYRNVIGSEQQLRTFSHQEIKDFYHRWYRPDLQAVIIVGDIDVDQMEVKLQKAMADIPAPVDPEQKEHYPIANNQEPLIAVVTDPEQTGAGVNFYIKRQAMPFEMNNTVPIALMNYIVSAATNAIQARLSDIAQQPSAPFVAAQFQNTALSESHDALTGAVAAAHNNGILRAFEAFYTEVERARQYGITQAELDLYKANALERAHQSYLRRDNRRSDDFAKSYFNHFAKNSPIPAADTKWQIDSVLISALTVDIVNQVFEEMLTTANNVIVVTLPEQGVRIPSENDIIAIMEKVHNATIAPHEEVVINEPLIAHDITPGEVVHTENGMFGSTVWTLNNGAKVVLKPTDFSKEQVSMNAHANGGASLLSDDDYLSVSVLSSLVELAGVGKFTASEVPKILAGKTARAKPAVSRFSSGISASSSKKDVETMLQLTHLYFTDIRFTRDDFNRLTGMLRTQLNNMQHTPDFTFQKEASKTLYGDHPRAITLSSETLDKIEFERVTPIYETFFKNQVDNYTFYFVGDFDPEQVKPLVEKYIGGLPAGDQKLECKDDHMQVRRGQITNRFAAKMETPQTTIACAYTGDIDYTQENSMTMRLLAECLRLRYLESIREEQGGAYNIDVQGAIARQPFEIYSLEIGFKTDPDMVDQLLVIVEDEIRIIAERGPRAEDVGKTVENWTKAFPESLRQNSTWMAYLTTYYTWGDDFYINSEQILKSLNGEKVQTLAQKILKDGNLIKIIMEPDK